MMTVFEILGVMFPTAIAFIMLGYWLGYRRLLDDIQKEKILMRHKNKG